MYRKGFTRHSRDGLVYLTIPSFDDTGMVKHCFTTRLGGVSQGCFSSLNLGLKKDDHRGHVMKNYRILCRQLGIDIHNLVLSDQVHDDVIRVVTEKDRGKGIVRPSDIKGVDGLVTDCRQVALVTFYADCVPIFVLDPVNRAVALSHGGWKGTVKQIAVKTVAKMVDAYGTNPKDCLAAIGPSIGPCCFEVDRPVAQQFSALGYDSFIEKRVDKYLINLWAINAEQMVGAGIPASNITVANECTRCNNHVYFSHRGDNGRTGSLASVIQLS
ncbi:MAG: peptidoglycan editing factor PgeF [Mahellales bacterium]